MDAVCEGLVLDRAVASPLCQPDARFVGSACRLAPVSSGGCDSGSLLSEGAGISSGVLPQCLSCLYPPAQSRSACLLLRGATAHPSGSFPEIFVVVGSRLEKVGRLLKVAGRTSKAILPGSMEAVNDLHKRQVRYCTSLMNKWSWRTRSPDGTLTNLRVMSEMNSEQKTSWRRHMVFDPITAHSQADDPALTFARGSSVPNEIMEATIGVRVSDG